MFVGLRSVLFLSYGADQQRVLLREEIARMKQLCLQLEEKNSALSAQLQKAELERSASITPFPTQGPLEAKLELMRI